MSRSISIIGKFSNGKEITIGLYNSEESDLKSSKFTKQDIQKLQEDFLENFFGKEIEDFSIYYFVSGTILNHFEDHKNIFNHCTIRDNEYIEMIEHYVKLANSYT